MEGGASGICRRPRVTRQTSDIRFTRYVPNPLRLPGFQIESAFRISGARIVT